MWRAWKQARRDPASRVWVHPSRCAAQRVCVLSGGVGRRGSSRPDGDKSQGALRQQRWYLAWRAGHVKFWGGILSTTREQSDGQRPRL